MWRSARSRPVLWVELSPLLLMLSFQEYRALAFSKASWDGCSPCGIPQTLVTSESCRWRSDPFDRTAGGRISPGFRAVFGWAGRLIWRRWLGDAPAHEPGLGWLSNGCAPISSRSPGPEAYAWWTSPARAARGGIGPYGVSFLVVLTSARQSGLVGGDAERAA